MPWSSGGTALGGTLGVVGETGTGVIEGVDEKEGRGTSGTTGGDVTSEPLGVTLGLLETEQGLCKKENQAESND